MSEILRANLQYFCSPSKVTFGLDAVRVVGDEAKRLSGNKALLVTDPVTMEANLIRPVVDSLEAAKISYSLFDGVEHYPTTALVSEAVEKLRLEGCNLIIGLGDGSSLDVAKAVSVLATNQEMAFNPSSVKAFRQRGAPKILIPTTYAPAGPLSPYAIVYSSGKDLALIPIISEFAIPEVAIFDPLLSASLPQDITLDSAMNALATAIAAFAAPSANTFSDLFAGPAIELGTHYLFILQTRDGDLTARYFMSLTAIFADLAFVSADAATLIALSLPVANAYGLTYGRAFTIILPHVMRHSLASIPEKYACVASLMGKETHGLSAPEASLKAVEAVQEILEVLQVPCQLRSYGASEADASSMAREAMALANRFLPNRRDLNEHYFRTIYEASY